MVDAQSERAFERADRVRAGYARLLGSPARVDDGHYALGGSRRELTVRFLSALPFGRRRVLVTTDGEFRSIDRRTGPPSRAHTLLFFGLSPATNTAAPTQAQVGHGSPS